MLWKFISTKEKHKAVKRPFDLWVMQIRSQEVSRDVNKVHYALNPGKHLSTCVNPSFPCISMWYCFNDIVQQHAKSRLTWKLLYQCKSIWLIPLLSFYKKNSFLARTKGKDSIWKRTGYAGVKPTGRSSLPGAGRIQAHTQLCWSEGDLSQDCAPLSIEGLFWAGTVYLCKFIYKCIYVILY